MLSSIRHYHMQMYFHMDFMTLFSFILRQTLNFNLLGWNPSQSLVIQVNRADSVFKNSNVIYVINWI